MNTYRVYFYKDGVDRFKTIIHASDLGQAIQFVRKKIYESDGYFELEGKSNRYFTVEPGGVDFIEYEVFFQGEEIAFEDFAAFDKTSLGIITEKVTSNYTFAVAIFGATEKTKESFWEVTTENRRKEIEDMIAELGHIGLTEIMDAQREIVEIASKLKTQKLITITKKHHSQI